MATELGTKVTNLVGLLPILSYLILWLHGFARSRDKLKPYLHTTTPTTIKHREMVNYHEVLLNIKSHTSSIKWSCKIT